MMVFRLQIRSIHGEWTLICEKGVMMKPPQYHENVDRWARLRFSIIGGLLASPPKHGELQKALSVLAARHWRHPDLKKGFVQFDAATIERWYYRARGAADPLAALSRKVRGDVGQVRVVGQALEQALEQQYTNHGDWSLKLHYDNLAVVVAEDSSLGVLPSYSTVRRHMKRHGMTPRRKLPRTPTSGQIAARERLEKREVRSFEVSYVHGLWHLDFHQGRRKIVDAKGVYHVPRALCVLDDCSRLICHIQWYLDEKTQSLVHGITQAFYKRGLPRALLTDNGSAMLSEEFCNGLERLGITHKKTLAYSPYQNGKQETLWAQLEGRLMKMLSDVDVLGLKGLNDATQAWAEMDYNRRVHSELGMSPLTRMLQGPLVNRTVPSTEKLRLAFCHEISRTQRKSDGTVSIDGVRFEVPWRFHHCDSLRLRYQSWDLRAAFVVDVRDGSLLCRIMPRDKKRNADAQRRRIDKPSAGPHKGATKTHELPPLLRRYMEDYAATGLPPAYIPTGPLRENDTSKGGDENV